MSGTADPSGTATGFYCTTLNNNKLRIDGSSLKMTGTINYSFPGLTDPISFQLNDFTIFKQNATSGDVLGTIPGSVTQTINNMPVTFEYLLRSEAGENVASLNSNGVTYADVKKSKIILNLKITTTQTITGVPTPITVVIMDAQDVITSTLHYSNGIGMVYCNTLFNYSLNPSVATLLPSNIPLSQNATQDEYLTAYHVN
jgi:hypothetical protein